MKTEKIIIERVYDYCVRCHRKISGHNEAELKYKLKQHKTKCDKREHLPFT